jgi:hypothetical protein
MIARKYIAWVILVFCVTGFGALPKASAADAEDAFWKSVTKGNVIEEYEIYLQQYPTGRYTVEALRRLDEIKELTRLKEEIRLMKESEAKKHAVQPPLANSNYGSSKQSVGGRCATDSECGSALFCYRLSSSCQKR